MASERSVTAPIGVAVAHGAEERNVSCPISFRSAALQTTDNDGQP